MHPLHEYVAKQLADKLKDRHLVVWYDERREFRSDERDWGRAHDRDWDRHYREHEGNREER